MLTNEIEILISRFDDPDLTDSERQELDQQLQSNSEAQEYHRQLQSLDKHLDALAPNIDQIDFRGFAYAVNKQIDAIQTSRPPRRIAWRWLAPLSAAAAIVMVALPWFNKPTPTPTPPTSIIVLAHAKPIISQPIVRVTISSAKPQTQVSIAKVALASHQTVTPPEINDSLGEIICFAGPALRRQTIKRTSTPTNDYLVF